ncbi:MAG: hypothetical protein HQ541_13370 [Mariniphaga sp.]|nr:hypothetical protein [Mariniphaga sp.]
MKRREFVKNSGRWLILGGIGAIVIYFSVNNRIASASECTISPVCNSCNRFAKCALPQAEKQKEDGKES